MMYIIVAIGRKVLVLHPLLWPRDNKYALPIVSPSKTNDIVENAPRMKFLRWLIEEKRISLEMRLMYSSAHMDDIGYAVSE
ncbi:hypothetical protein AB6A40_011756 [Gnathostoma spinigerum]|uniref:Uncharacterized protein n=1 Tax=Gnathostoma spinigerum TaxID=75299 RepID=A0ABD6F0J4_9BILA